MTENEIGTIATDSAIAHKSFFNRCSICLRDRLNKEIKLSDPKRLSVHLKASE